MAVQMEPNNLRYQELLQQLQGGGNVYREQSRAYGRPFDMQNIVSGGVWQIQFVIVVVVQDLYVRGGMYIEKIYV